jgi:hypothetical protein
VTRRDTQPFPISISTLLLLRLRKCAFKTPVYKTTVSYVWKIEGQHGLSSWGK